MTPEDISKLETLAGLHLDDEERRVLSERLERLLAYVRQIEEIDSEGTLPLASTAEEAAALRADEAEESYSVERALANAPDAQDSHFRIPPVMPPATGDDA